ncbi:MAG: hypothetical protein ACE5JI_20795, partial [Acidobacteriota bacterium]
VRGAGGAGTGEESMKTSGRRVLAAFVAGAVAASLVRYFTGEPSLRDLLEAAAVVAVFWPLKGALLRFLGGVRPYWSALAAGVCSELLGLGFPFASLGLPWPALVAGLGVSSVMEGLVLVLMGTARVRRCFGMALYVNVCVHVLVAGMFLWETRPLVSSVVFVVGFALFILPIFVIQRPLGEPAKPQ